MKIVFLSPAAQRGGAEAVLLELLSVLREARPAWSLHVLAGEDGPLLEKIRAMHVPCETLSFPAAVRSFGENRQAPASPDAMRTWRSVLAKIARLASWLRAGAGVLIYGWRLRRRLGQLRPDLLHSNGMKMHLLGALAKQRSIPLVWHLHDYLGTRPAMKPLLRRLSSRCALVIANSESVATDVRNVLTAGPTVHAVYNAVDLDVFTPSGATLDLDQLAGLPPPETPGTLRIGLVATFAFWKGHEIFLRAAAAAATGTHRFYVIGGPVYATAGSQRSLEELRALARTLGIQDRVGFTGFVEDVPAAMRALDIVVHASTEPEPFGLVIVQAMACGRAVIISAAGGARELVEPGIDALVHSPGNARELTTAIDRLAADPELRTRVGIAGRLHAKARFARQRMAENLVPLYEAGGRPLPSWTPIPERRGQGGTMKVLHLSSGNLYGGVEVLLATLSRERACCPAMEPHFALCFSGRLSEQLAGLGTPAILLGSVQTRFPWQVWQARRRLARLLREQAFDVVVCHMAWSQAIFGPVVRRAKLPLVYWMHDAAEGKHWIERWAARCPPDFAVCNSRFTAGSLCKLFPCSTPPHEVIYCPVSAPTSVLPPDSRATVRAELGTPLDACVIIQVGRMEPYKGHVLHLEALARLMDVPGWMCWIVGGAQRPHEQAYLASLQEQAKAAGLGERVRFTGSRHDVPALLNAADIFCQPNLGPEPFGIVFIEALNASLPVVSTAQGGALEIIDKTCGFLVPPNSPESLADTLRQLITDVSLRNSLGRDGPARAAQLCDPANVLTKLVKVFSGLDTSAVAQPHSEELCSNTL